MTEKKVYKSAPLPFMGQKRMFIKELEKVLEELKDKTIFVDLFGGSGLLSYFVKSKRPDATVVYNDFDNYRQRLQHIPNTNTLLSEFRKVVKDCPKGKAVPPEMRKSILAKISDAEKKYGYVDYITISSSLLFSARYVLNFDDLNKQGIYNNICKNDYCADGYLDGLVVVDCDYRDLFKKYKNNPEVVFLVDPPYLNTSTQTYKMCWKLADYLDVLEVLKDTTYIYFTSNKSSIVELCQWIGDNPAMRNPFEGATKVEREASMNYSVRYTDTMLYKRAA